MIIKTHVQVFLLLAATCISSSMCQILHLNTSSAIRRYRRVLLPAPHPLRAPSHSFGQPSLSPAPGEALSSSRLYDHHPNLRNTQSVAKKYERPVRPPYAGFEDMLLQERAPGIRYSIDHSVAPAPPAVIGGSSSNRPSGGRVSQSVRLAIERDTGSSVNRRQRPVAASSFDHDLTADDKSHGSLPPPLTAAAAASHADQSLRNTHNNWINRNSNNNSNLNRRPDRYEETPSNGGEIIPFEGNDGDVLNDEVFATFNPLREISQPARIQFLYRDETFPKSTKPSTASHRTDPPPTRPSINQNQRSASASNRHRIDERNHRSTLPPIPFIERTATTRDRARDSQALRNDFREYVASPLLPSTISSFSPTSRSPTARYVTPATQWFPPPTPAPGAIGVGGSRSHLMNHEREALLLKELRDEDERVPSARPPPPSTPAFISPTSRPRDRDSDSNHRHSAVSYYPEEVRSTSRSPPEPLPPPPQRSNPQLLQTAPRVTHPDHDRDRRRYQHHQNSNNNNNQGDNDRDRPQFSAPVREEVVVVNEGSRNDESSGAGGREEVRVNARVTSRGEESDRSLDYDLGEVPADRDTLLPVVPRDRERGELMHDKRTELRPHQPPPPAPPAARVPVSRIEFPSHRELPPVTVVQPTESPPSLAAAPEESWNTGRTRQGRRIRPPKQEDSEERARERQPERPERPERPAKPVIVVKDLPPVTAAPPKSTTSDDAFVRAGFARGAPIDHGTPLGLQDYPIEDLKQDPPSQPKSNDPEDDVPRETRPPPPPTRRSRTRSSRRRNKNKKKERVQQRLPHNFNRLPSRPANVYETPIALEMATKCDPSVCILPDCNCGHAKIPGNLKVHQVPQIIMLTFDDAINDLNWELYQEIFHSGRKNPNDCPPLGTFYVSHEWTDYGQVQTLYSMGHEMASHGVTHSFGEKFSKRQWMREIQGQREVLHLYGGVKLEDVRGMRAPFLQVGGNKMFEMLFEANFTYDSSMPVFDNRPPFFPYTLDYALNHECMITPCPTKSFPGLWEVGQFMFLLLMHVY